MATVNRLDGSYELPSELPVIALRDVVFFPYLMLPLLIGRPPSVAALEEAETGEGLALLVAQKDPAVDSPGQDDLHSVGTVIRLVQTSRLADGTVRTMMDGVGRARIKKFVSAEPSFRAVVEPITEWEYEPDPMPDPMMDEIVDGVVQSFREYVRLSDQLPNSVGKAVQQVGDRVSLGHLMAGHLLVGPEEKQELLEMTDTLGRFQILREILVREVEVLTIQEKLDEQIRLRMGGPEEDDASLTPVGGDDGADPEWSKLSRAIAETAMPEHAEARATEEFERLVKLSPVAPEASVIRTYLDWIVSLPWEEETSDSLDVVRAAAVLEEEHYGLREVKERVLDHIAVLSLVGKLQGPILCLVGPPGVGKTSLGRSIGRCLRRNFVRVSLGGVRDEAEIRGHRRTYVGALPGRVIQGMRKAGSRNPVFLLDEVDKMAKDFHGDPGSALLEVLDPEQNRSFADHYLELEFDLSQVLFLATANTLGGVPEPLRDRMEVIRLPGYLDTEKKAIARQFLWPKQVARHGIEPFAPRIDDEAIQAIIAEYTREAGVRELERRLSRVARKLARQVADGDETMGVDSGESQEAGRERDAAGGDKVAPDSVRDATQQGTAGDVREADGGSAGDAVEGRKAVSDNMQKSAQQSTAGDLRKGRAVPETATSAKAPNNPTRLKKIAREDLRDLLGPPTRTPSRREDGGDRYGIACGLAWTAAGGEVMEVEVAVVPGSGKIQLTGTLGEVMKESAFAAVTYARSRAHWLKLSSKFHRETDIHIHIPEGATPKDGPSAGITIAVALISALTETTTRPDLAMTGEITLRGRVLVVGGIKEKAVAALRDGIKRVLLPAANAVDIDQLPEEVLAMVELVPVETMDQVLQEALVSADLDFSGPARGKPTGEKRAARTNKPPPVPQVYG